MQTKLKVLAKPKNGRTNPRNGIVYSQIGSISNGCIEVQEFNLFRAFGTSFDTLHFHWPDLIFRSGDIVAWVKLILFSVLLKYCKFMNRKILWTVHNPRIKIREVRESLKRKYFRILHRNVDHYIFPSHESKEVFFNVCAEYGLNIESMNYDIIPLGVQSEVVAKGSTRPPELDAEKTNYLLIVGRIAPEKNIDVTVRDIRSALTYSKIPIVVAGNTSSSRMKVMLDDLKGWKKLTFIDRFLTDEEINYLISNSLAVVIDYPVTNSGVATLAVANSSTILIKNKALVDSFQKDYQYDQVFPLRTSENIIIEYKFDKLSQRGKYEGIVDLSNVAERHADLYSRLYQKGKT